MSECVCVCVCSVRAWLTPSFLTRVLVSFHSRCSMWFMMKRPSPDSAPRRTNTSLTKHNSHDLEQFADTLRPPSPHTHPNTRMHAHIHANTQHIHIHTHTRRQQLSAPDTNIKVFILESECDSTRPPPAPQRANPDLPCFACQTTTTVVLLSK